MIKVHFSLPAILGIAADAMSAGAVLDVAAIGLQHLDGATVALDHIEHLGHGRILDATHKLSRHTTT